ncbi:MAG: hypothetical protein QM723_15485 [Myxococcaceae bacterium]
MKSFPPELEDVLTPKGRKALAGKVPELAGALTRQGLAYGDGLLQEKFARAVPAFFEKHFTAFLQNRETRLLPAGLSAAGEIHKVMRCETCLSSSDGVLDRLQETGVLAFCQSASFLRLAEMLIDRPLAGPVSGQVLVNRAGDYAGPHIDSAPQDPYAKDGYLDVHFTFSTPGVKRQLLIYEQGGHLTGVREMTGIGALTAYALPRWHYTTPLEVSRPKASRWVLITGWVFHPNAPREFLRHAV